MHCDACKQDQAISHTGPHAHAQTLNRLTFQALKFVNLRCACLEPTGTD